MLRAPARKSAGELVSEVFSPLTLHSHVRVASDMLNAMQQLMTPGELELFKMQIYRLREMLEPLESGALRSGNQLNGVWSDHTQPEILHLRGVIELFQLVVDRFDADRT
jgi:hypothetical protein